MTVNELKSALAGYKPDLEVRIAGLSWRHPIERVAQSNDGTVIFLIPAPTAFEPEED